MKTDALGDIFMYLAVVPVSISLLFLKDDFRMVKKGFLVIAISAILRPITFNITRLSDPNPDSPANRYPCVPALFLLDAQKRGCSRASDAVQHHHLHV